MYDERVSANPPFPYGQHHFTTSKQTPLPTFRKYVSLTIGDDGTHKTLPLYTYSKKEQVLSRPLLIAMSCRVDVASSAPIEAPPHYSEFHKLPIPWRFIAKREAMAK